MADTEWRYRTGEKETGPITGEDLCRKFATGELRLDASVWCPAVQQWVSGYTIPAFRQAAAAAPPPSQPIAIPDLMPIKPDLYDKAASAAWITPLVALGITLILGMAARHANGNATASSGMRTCINLIMSLFVLGGLFAGVAAIYGVRKSRRARVVIPALVGVGINAMIIFAGAFSLHRGTPASAADAMPVQFGLQQKTPARGYAGWIGTVQVTGGSIVVGSLDDQSPAARRVLDNVTTPCSVLAITISNLNSPTPVSLDPSTLRLLSTQGTIDAVPLDDVLDTARADATEALRNVSSAQLIKRGSKPQTCVCFIPRGIDMHQVAAVTLLVNNQKVMVPGRFFSADEKQQYARSSGAPDAIQ